MKLINIKLNLSKIDKESLFKGEKGVYLDLMMSLTTKPDKFGNNASLWQGQTIEERNEKKEKKYLGTGKIIWSNSPSDNERDLNNLL